MPKIWAPSLYLKVYMFDRELEQSPRDCSAHCWLSGLLSIPETFLKTGSLALRYSRCECHTNDSNGIERKAPALLKAFATLFRFG